MTSAIQSTERSAANRKEKDQKHIESQATTSNNVQTTDVHEPVAKQEVLEPRGVERTRSGREYTPPVDIHETRDAIVIVADMPGVDENSVEVTLEKNILTIYGHVDTPQPAGYQLVYAEYGTGDYRRAFTISNYVDWARIEGTVNAGVLTLTLPKMGPVESKKIAIKPAV